MRAEGGSLRYDALIAGAGPIGTYAGLLMHNRGLRVGVLEAGAREEPRLQPLIIGGDGLRMFTSVGAKGLPTLDPSVSAPVGYVPICDVVRSLRDAGEHAGMEMRFRTPIEAVERTDAGIAVTAGGDRLEAPLLFDFTGGKLHAGDPVLGLREVGGTVPAAAVSWGTAHGIPAAAAFGTDDAIRATAELDGLRATFVGHHDAARGSFGTIQFDQRPSATQRTRLAHDIQSKLGLRDGAPEVLSPFTAANRISSTAWDRGVALGGDSVATYLPRKSIGLRTGLWDAPDAVELALAHARPQVDPATSYGARLQDVAVEQYTSRVMQRHRDAMHTEQNGYFDRF